MLARCLDSLFHNFSAWSKPSSGVNASQCKAGQANDLLRSSGEAHFSFSPFYKELIGLIVQAILGLIIPKTGKEVELIGSTPPGALGLIIPRKEEGFVQIGLALGQNKRFVKRIQGSGLMNQGLVSLGAVTGEVKSSSSPWPCEMKHPPDVFFLLQK